MSKEQIQYETGIIKDLWKDDLEKERYKLYFDIKETTFSGFDSEKEHPIFVLLTDAFEQGKKVRIGFVENIGTDRLFFNIKSASYPGEQAQKQPKEEEKAQFKTADKISAIDDVIAGNMLILGKCHDEFSKMKGHEAKTEEELLTVRIVFNATINKVTPEELIKLSKTEPKTE